ncbi:hypothetical protein SI65_05717 [Aspergillus cristatus]|uniref:Uncharacterized protein n=1 Tax=Aspergillus cristatus TaxID=573508 RepID=A0A1E3BDQ2_ASPCR|nr:hypothetical protein SI65_05717 [Aspergillus cristatus]
MSDLSSSSPSSDEETTRWSPCLSADDVRVYYPRDVDWEEEYSKLCNAIKDATRRSTTVIFTTAKVIDTCKSPDKYIYFPDDFYPVVNGDINGSFHSKYIIDEEGKIASHISWSCFKIKNINIDKKSPKIEYNWLQVAVLVHFHAKTGRQVIFFIDLPSDHEDSVIKKSLFYTRQGSENPFIWHTILARQAKSLYDDTVWSVRDLVRPVEKARNKPNPPAPNFPNLHDIARHVSHANEILHVAEHTLDRLVQAQISWKTEYYDDNTGSAKRNRMVCLQNKQDLLFLAKEIHSLKTRSASLSERLQNEINLAFNIVSQNLGTNAQGDNAMMKTVAIVSLLYVPGSFVSSVFGMNFFDMGSENEFTVSNKFWIYWVITIPLTAVTVLIWAIWHWSDKIRRPRWPHLVHWS